MSPFSAMRPPAAPSEGPEDADAEATTAVRGGEEKEEVERRLAVVAFAAFRAGIAVGFRNGLRAEAAAVPLLALRGAPRAVGEDAAAAEGEESRAGFISQFRKAFFSEEEEKTQSEKKFIFVEKKIDAPPDCLRLAPRGSRGRRRAEAARVLPSGMFRCVDQSDHRARRRAHRLRRGVGRDWWR